MLGTQKIVKTLPVYDPAAGPIIPLENQALEYTARYATLLGFTVGMLMDLHPEYGSNSGEAQNNDALALDAGMLSVMNVVPTDSMGPDLIRAHVQRSLQTRNWHRFMESEVARGYPAMGPRPLRVQPMLSRYLLEQGLLRAAATLAGQR